MLLFFEFANRKSGNLTSERIFKLTSEDIKTPLLRKILREVFLRRLVKCFTFCHCEMRSNNGYTNEP